MTMAATAVGQWAATVSSRDLLIGDGNPGPGGAGSVIVRLHIPTHAACVLWVSSMAYGSANTTYNVAEY